MYLVSSYSVDTPFALHRRKQPTSSTW